MTPPDRLRALLAEPGFVVMPAVWDGLSAKLTAAAGFKTAFLSGSCVAASRLGGPNLDLLSFAEMFDSFNMVRGAAPDTLVLADADHGYGNAMNVQRTVRAYGRAGAAAILIEDKITPRALTSAGKPCLPREEARMKIRAAVEAAKEYGILVLARTDCRPTQGIDEAVARIEMYVQEGADILFLDSPADEDEIRRAIAAAAGRPSFAVLPPGAPRATPSRAKAAELGFKIGTYPTGLLSPAAAGMKAGVAALVAGDAEAASALPPPPSCVRRWATRITTPRQNASSFPADGPQPRQNRSTRAEALPSVRQDKTRSRNNRSLPRRAASSTMAAYAHHLSVLLRHLRRAGLSGHARADRALCPLRQRMAPGSGDSARAAHFRAARASRPGAGARQPRSGASHGTGSGSASIGNGPAERTSGASAVSKRFAHRLGREPGRSPRPGRRRLCVARPGRICVAAERPRLCAVRHATVQSGKPPVTADQATAASARRSNRLRSCGSR